MKKLQAILAGFGFVIFFVAASSYFESMQYSKWQSTEAILHAISLHNASSPTVAGASDSGANIGRARYTYRIDGKKYQGSRIIPLQSVYLQKDTVLNLTKGSITVSYNPNEPSESFIFANTPITQLIILISAGIIFMLLALGLPRLTSFFVRATSEST